MCRPTSDRYSQRGTPASPDKLAGKQRPGDRGDDQDRSRNAHSLQQHHAPSTFAIEKTTLPTRASPITEGYVSVAGISPQKRSRIRSGFRGPGLSACGAGVRRSLGDAGRGETSNMKTAANRGSEGGEGC